MGKNGGRDSSGVEARVTGNFNIDGFNPGGKGASIQRSKRLTPIVAEMPKRDENAPIPAYLEQMENGKFAVNASNYVATGGIIPQMHIDGVSQSTAEVYQNSSPSSQ